jgi:hypothetical protein
MEEPRRPEETESVSDPNSLLFVKNANNRGHRGILLLDDTHTLATFKTATVNPSLTLKVNFVGIPN